MAAGMAVTRRAFLADLGWGGVAVALVSLVGCAPSQASGRPVAATDTAAGSGVATASSTDAGGGASAAPSSSTAASASGATASGDPAGALAWERVNLGFVSAYVLVRGGEAAIVDTGIAGSEGAIEGVLTALGLSWDSVGHVIATHKHQDHVGSLATVLDRAAGATGYIGAGDLAAVSAPRPLTALHDGEQVFGLQVVETPGHTVGHISVLDEVAGVLVAGDALGTTGGTLAGSSPQFTEDATAAKATVVKLGKLRYETLLVGHGDPILTGASAKVAALAG